jgi:transposase-like protein
MDNLLTDDYKIIAVIKLAKCPFCEKNGVVFSTGGTGTGWVGGEGKLPDINFINYTCRECNKNFNIPKSLLNEKK